MEKVEASCYDAYNLGKESIKQNMHSLVIDEGVLSGVEFRRQRV